MKCFGFFKFIFFTFLIFLSLFSHAELYKYTYLQIKSSEEMNDLVEKQIKISDKILNQKKLRREEKETQAIAPLKEALKLIFSRPNKDHFIEQIYPKVKKRLVDLNTLDIALSEMVTEALVGLKKESLHKSYRATYLFVLENLMTELRPEIRKSKSVKRLFVRIQEADISLPRELIQYRKFNGMYKTTSPSEIAKKILSKK